MEYIFILCLQLFGILFAAGGKVLALDKQYADYNKRQIFAMYFDNEWVSLGLSLLFLLFNLFIHAMIDVFFPSVREVKIDFVIFGYNVLIPYIAISFTIAFGFAYGGQRLFYKYFGKLDDYISSKAD